MVTNDQTKDTTEDTPVDADEDPTESTRRGLGVLLNERLYELSDRVIYSKSQPLKIILIMVLVIGFVYWALIYLEVLSPFF